jgi:hypothetical protein
MKIVERLASLMQHLQLEAACFATQIPGDIAELAAQFPERITGLVLCVPTRLDTRPFAHVSPRLLMIAGEAGLSAATSRRALVQLPGAQEHILPGYNAQGWSDVVADRKTAVVGAMISFLRKSCSGPPIAGPPATSGTHSGLSYRVVGQGRLDLVTRAPGKGLEVAFLARAALVVGADTAVDGNLSQVNPLGICVAKARKIGLSAPQVRNCGVLTGSCQLSTQVRSS